VFGKEKIIKKDIIIQLKKGRYNDDNML